MSKRHWIRSYGSNPPEIDADRYPSVNALLQRALVQIAEVVEVVKFDRIAY